MSLRNRGFKRERERERKRERETGVEELRPELVRAPCSWRLWRDWNCDQFHPLEVGPGTLDPLAHSFSPTFYLFTFWKVKLRSFIIPVRVSTGQYRTVPYSAVQYRTILDNIGLSPLNYYGNLPRQAILNTINLLCVTHGFLVRVCWTVSTKDPCCC